MTAREKLEIEYPECIDKTFWGGCVGCPDKYGYLARPAFCKDKLHLSEANCDNCWDREIPNIVERKPDENDCKMVETIEKENYMSECCKETMCTTCIHQDVCSLKEKFLDAQKAVDGLVVYDKLPDGKLGQVKLRYIGFIKPVELACIHYIYKGSAGVKGGFHA